MPYTLSVAETGIVPPDELLLDEPAPLLDDVLEPLDEPEDDEPLEDAPEELEDEEPPDEELDVDEPPPELLDELDEDAGLASVIVPVMDTGCPLAEIPLLVKL